jgi:hypothetical protein
MVLKEIVNIEVLTKLKSLKLEPEIYRIKNPKKNSQIRFNMQIKNIKLYGSVDNR